MSRNTMPPAEIGIDIALVESLLHAQKPDLAGLEVTELAFGWDNVSFRVGDLWVARFPRREKAVPLIAHEARWLPELAGRLPLPVPAPVFAGDPGDHYPWPWLVAPFLEGESAAVAGPHDLGGCARQLGEFLALLHTPAPPDAPINPFRGVPLAARDEITRQRLLTVIDGPDRHRLERVWDRALHALPYPGPAVWLHGDLHPHNLLVADGLISGVVDFGDITSGDPAVDLAISWSFLAGAQDTFWGAYGKDDEATRARTAGWAVALALAYLANSADNSVMEAIGETSLRAILEVF